ncbi:hypothetical protein FB559_7820 [Actinoallomurus bryophytorum]|uniref:Uncharacterized protein n=1 Tax=Actinoallomurus bryophytorum TaxID=1490222 RepID=A0A543C0C0_9ACTN|nr:hypothetical protein FB559_7820 [Actinoallomurus bryophytorum]
MFNLKHLVGEVRIDLKQESPITADVYTQDRTP